MMFVAAAAAILVTMAMALIRAIKGPEIYDRILAVNTFGTLTMLLIPAFGFLSGRPEFMDLALVYALINFIGTIAVTKYAGYADMGHGDGRDDVGDI